ncbi:YifB family Mg chelatase-like AAA ATPase [Parafannyhessea umbonata]|uniref:YifB family Mg chelatase-like AAA ATPase n=1 Tax=Parafannyhessea umbonata TaxID=604330 RepID=UPI0026EAA4DB|nr:YifB family Mg chelatase-like AAA ATPase [Parafannyhessea umbonata]MCI6937627.1 YifB family Mg chelatase-like AAA ATPase [Clostridiales bacterium]MCI7218966.1 YifB family Mg chelatase-like AAA ATPase [Parafannyhessea umbonata]MDD5884090.1 YifB family Mg chelatase-like AAA ATPase [Bacillota bacterium]MDY4599430.1 YifB family Mg chelatase-like AAA ATPase [Candidatus Faecousia sp.]
MICSVKTLGISGIQGSLVTAECYISNGLPGFDIVGLPDAAVKEARERVRAAAKSSGLGFPASRITVNLAPASLKKTGTHYDLPILLGILCALGSVRRPRPDCAFLGEVSLDGQIRPVSGVLPMALAAKREGIQTLFVPAENAAEATLARGPAIIPVHTIRELAAGLNGEAEFTEQPPWVPEGNTAPELDFKDVLGQENVKRALEVAAAGSHNVLLIGPPGSGKSMLSKRLPSILPDMTWEEALEVSQIYSVMGLLTAEQPLIVRRPFRSPHHTISNAGLAGGGTNPRPGEISMAHKGVLFLDEMPEFRKDTLDLMRQPLEDGKVTISRVSGAVTYPAEFMLVCAMNPCKCGWYGDPSGRCRCSEREVESYRSRISGPMLDRIDIVVEVPAVHFEELRARAEAEASAAIKQRVDKARQIQNRRFHGTGLCNARMGPEEMRRYCALSEESAGLMKNAFEVMGLTARSYDRILRVARTVADLDGSEEIQPQHIAEAIQYRAVNLGNR